MYGNVYPGTSFAPKPTITGELLETRRQLMYHYNLTYILDISQNKPIHDQPLPFRLPFFGFEFNYAYILRDGHLGFNKGLLSYRYPLKFPMQPTDPLSEEDPSMIAIWFAQQDIPGQTEVPSELLHSSRSLAKIVCKLTSCCHHKGLDSGGALNCCSDFMLIDEK